MSTFKNIQGKNIRSYTTNAPNATAGEMWYNRAELKLKGVVASGAWSSTSPLNTAISYAYTGGTQNAAFSAAGAPGPKVQTEEYNGSGWSIGNNVGTARYEGGSAGTLTAGLMYGGYEGPPAPSPYPKAQTEEYDGTSWSEQNDLNTSRYSQGGFGTQTAAVYTNGGNPVADTEEYNGTSWSEGNNSTTNRFDVGTAGILTAGMIFGGQQPTPAVLSATELYDGTNWTNGPSLNNQRSQLGGSGIQTSALAFGGRYYPSPPVRAFTEQFDGTSWSEVGDLATARRQLSSPRASSSNASSLAIGGSGPGNLAITEEWNFTANTVTAAAWSSGGNLNTAREQGGTAGTTPAGIYMTGKVYPNTFKNETEEYNGTSWSEQNNVSTGRTSSGSGTQTAAIIFGGTNGAPGSTGVQTATEEYDGSSWTNGGALSTARLGMYGAGLQTACFGAGGIGSPNTTVTSVEDYNGSSWTSGTAIPAAQQGGGSAGLPSARLVFGGYSPYSAVTLEGDGEGWTAGSNMLQARGILAGFGSQTDAIAAGGSVNPNANSALVEGYDGTSWSTRPSLATARMSFSPSGAYNTTTGGFVAGGSQQGNPQNAQTEEWNAETTSVNIVDITTS